MDVLSNYMYFSLLPRRARKLDLPEHPLCHCSVLLSASSTSYRSHTLGEHYTHTRFAQHVIPIDSRNCAIYHTNALHNQESSQLTVKNSRQTWRRHHYCIERERRNSLLKQVSSKHLIKYAKQWSSTDTRQCWTEVVNVHRDGHWSLACRVTWS